jgi:hypothetical protein
MYKVVESTLSVAFELNYVYLHVDQKLRRKKPNCQQYDALLNFMYAQNYISGC